ncbi:PD-(D/E)XK nuclease family protein [Odoribacter sp. OttesenSCG-928-L07]|nr:PD-(D/E)XK nuclease family protein [Odoribacter sp. OttesenSCG-928-L07]
MREFINHEKFDGIEKRIFDVKDYMDNNGFNLFTISSYGSHLENFHSDIIALLLNPKERHKLSHTFLDLFIKFLNSKGFCIQKDDYRNSEVLRETGRIDIWIKDSISKKSIIIENKINNAGDMDDQIERYYNYAIENGFSVDCVIYLSLNGNKIAPLTDNKEINDIILNVSAFSNNQDDLYHSWILGCYEVSKNNEDCSSFIYQYGKLLKHLSKMGIDKDIKNDFYEIVSQGTGLEKMKAITELANGLEEYRADLFIEKIGKNYAPFKKTYRYKPWHWLFENLIIDNILYKLDVHFYTGKVRIDFWNPNEDDDRSIIADKLDSIGLYEDFEEYGFGNGMYKEFVVSPIKSLKEIDNEVLQYIQVFFEKLR